MDSNQQKTQQAQARYIYNTARQALGEFNDGLFAEMLIKYLKNNYRNASLDMDIDDDVFDKQIMPYDETYYIDFLTLKYNEFSEKFDDLAVEYLILKRCHGLAPDDSNLKASLGHVAFAMAFEASQSGDDVSCDKLFFEAETLFAQILHKDGETSRVYNDLFKVYHGQGIYHKALYAIQQAERVGPDCFETFMNKATLFLHKKMYGEAALAVQQLLDFDPHNETNHKAMKDLAGWLLNEAKDPIAAQILLRPIKAIDHTDPDVEQGLAMCHWQMAVEQQEKDKITTAQIHQDMALEHLETAVRLSYEERDDLCFDLGRVYLEMEEPGKAQEMFEKALKANKKYGGSKAKLSHSYLASIFKKSGDMAKATYHGLRGDITSMGEEDTPIQSAALALYLANDLGPSEKAIAYDLMSLKTGGVVAPDTYNVDTSSDRELEITINPN